VQPYRLCWTRRRPWHEPMWLVADLNLAASSERSILVTAKSRNAAARRFPRLGREEQVGAANASREVGPPPGPQAPPQAAAPRSRVDTTDHASATTASSSLDGSDQAATAPSPSHETVSKPRNLQFAYLFCLRRLSLCSRRRHWNLHRSVQPHRRLALRRLPTTHEPHPSAGSSLL
jgi:hypothetical protein